MPLSFLSVDKEYCIPAYLPVFQACFCCAFRQPASALLNISPLLHLQPVAVLFSGIEPVPVCPSYSGGIYAVLPSYQHRFCSIVKIRPAVTDFSQAGQKLRFIPAFDIPSFTQILPFTQQFIIALQFFFNQGNP